MEIIIGVGSHTRSLDSVALGLAIASTIDATPVIANVYPTAFDFPGQGHVDAEWQAFLIERAEETLVWIRDQIGNRQGIEYAMTGHRSSGAGLAKIAVDRDASMIVIGSSYNASEGRIGCGSTADKLLHGSPVPVALAPFGYYEWAPELLHHVVLAYRKTPESDHALKIVTDTFLKRPVHSKIGLNLVTIIERHTRVYGSRLGSSAETLVVEAARQQALEALHVAQSRIPEGLVETTSELLEGDNVVSALAKFDWHDDDIFVAGSSGGRALRRVFLGDMTYKLLRGSQLPVVIIPSGAEV